MKQLLLLTSDYYPYPSSNTNCLEPMLEVLEQHGWEVDIVTRKMRAEFPSFEEGKSRRVFRIEDHRTMHTIQINNWKSRASSKVSKAFRLAWSVISKSAYYIRYCLFRREHLVAGWDKKEVLKKCVDLCEQNKYDAFISVSTPVINHEIALQVKKQVPHLYWIFMEFDPFSMGEHLYGKNTYKKLYPEHAAYFTACDGIMTIPQLYEYYKNSPDFQQFLEKIAPIEYPNMKQFAVDYANVVPLTLSAEKINAVFAGVLQANIRDPHYLFKVFKHVKAPIQAHLISGSRLGFIEDEISAATHVTVYPKQTRDTCYDAMQRANLLINIGNDVSFQTPGKIFEYMALGKPIIHFCKIPNDPCLYYFKNYPLVLVVHEYENNPQEDAKRIEEFCEVNKNRTLSYEEVKTYIPHLISENVTNHFYETMMHLTK